MRTGDHLLDKTADLRRHQGERCRAGSIRFYLYLYAGVYPPRSDP